MRKAWFVGGASLIVSLVGFSVAAAPKEEAPAAVEVSFLEGQGAAQSQRHYRLPLPPEEGYASLRVDEAEASVSIDVSLHQDKEGKELLRYEIERHATGKGAAQRVDVSGQLPLPTGEAVTVAGSDSAELKIGLVR